MRELAAQFLALAEKQRATVARGSSSGIAYGLTSLLLTGDFTGARAHFEQCARALRSTEHRPLAAPFGLDVRQWRLALIVRSALWPLGYPEAGARSTLTRRSPRARDRPSRDLMFALLYQSLTQTSPMRKLRRSKSEADELHGFGGRKGLPHWKAVGNCAKVARWHSEIGQAGRNAMRNGITRIA